MANACPHRCRIVVQVLFFWVIVACIVVVVVCCCLLLLSLLLLCFGNFWVFVGVHCVFTLPKKSNYLEIKSLSNLGT